MPKANTIKTVPSTGTTSIGSARAGHCFDCVRFGYCVQIGAQNSAPAWAPGTGIQSEQGLRLCAHGIVFVALAFSFVF